VEQFIFDGIWLTQINYQIKAVKKYQLAEPNQPVDAFEVTSNNIPLIGFTKIEDLKKQFEITLVAQKDGKPQTFSQLHLKVKPNSRYEDDYVSLDFRIDKKLGLPTKIIAVSAEPGPQLEDNDVYEIRFLKPRINKKIAAKVFDFKIPKGFGEPEIVPLKKKDK
ncbi:MAG: LolA family protein, partial [Planctomycetota bacterium]